MNETTASIKPALKSAAENCGLYVARISAGRIHARWPDGAEATFGVGSDGAIEIHDDETIDREPARDEGDRVNAFGRLLVRARRRWSDRTFSDPVG